jgi:uncharacterized repeat protein (TIGR03803 family)
MTFVQDHAHGILACDFFVTVTAGFRVLYVFVIMEVGTRRIAHFNVTAHPTADWTLQQFREVITGVAGLVLDTAGNLYGTTTTTIVGRVYGAGVVFKLTPTGSETVLHNFTVAGGGAEPYGGLLRDKAGNLYGTTSNGGAYHYGVVFELIPCDSGYGFSVVYSFPGGADGGNPHAGLIQDAVGNLYGTTGTFYPGYNVVFKLSPSGTETVLHTFTGGADGYDPQAGLIQDPAGNLYGTTVDGGSARSGLCGQIGGCGVVFKLTP